MAGFKSFDVTQITKADYLAAFDGSVTDAAAAIKVAPTTVYGWREDLGSYRFQCAVHNVCEQCGRGDKLRSIVQARLKKAA